MRGQRTSRAAAAGMAIAVWLAVSATAVAGPQSATAPLDISGGNPLAACPPDGFGINYPDAEVEPWVDVNPQDPGNIVAIYQQDRYSNGAAKGNVSSASVDGGRTWTQVAVPADTVCTGGQFDRASDPWLSFSPNGTLHAMSLVTDSGPAGPAGDNGMVYNRSTTGGRSWEPPVILAMDTRTRSLHDKKQHHGRPQRLQLRVCGLGSPPAVAGRNK